MSTANSQFLVDLPGGGALALGGVEEVDLWEGSAKRYIEDYGLHKQNDLVLVGAILSQQLAMYRAQQDLNDTKKASSAQNTIIKAATEIRELEKALGIDKKTREQGGQHTVADFITRLKRAGHEKAVRISERVKEHEALANELRWRIRLYRNGDDEDRAYHRDTMTADTIVDFAERGLATIEANDQKWAREKGKVFVGRL